MKACQYLGLINSGTTDTLTSNDCSFLETSPSPTSCSLNGPSLCSNDTSLISERELTYARFPGLIG